MTVRTFDDAERSLQDGAEAGVLNDTQLRLMTEEVDADKARVQTIALESADRHFDHARSIGEPTRDEHVAIESDAEAVAHAIAHGRMSPAEGRRALDALLARYSRASDRYETFRNSAKAAIEIEADPLEWGRQFLHTYPGARASYSW